MGFFNRKKKAELPVMHFAGGEAFVDYHCKYMNTRLEPGLPLAAVVIDPREQFGLPIAVKVDDNGIQTAMLRVASDDGGFMVMAQTASANGAKLVPGDAVAWIPQRHMPQLAQAAEDERFGWMGLIVAKVAPEIDENTKQMKVLSRY